MPSWRGMEHDEYDNLAATYLVAIANGRVVGGLRSRPTEYPGYKGSMIADKFRYLVAGDMPSGPTIHEGTWFAVEHNLTNGCRNSVKDVLVLGHLEFSLLISVTQIIGIVPVAIWRSLFVSRGWPVTILGGQPLPPMKILSVIEGLGVSSP
ncbi:MAG: hypothetical protein MJE77_46780 [Proteobacteria bacterium]|nr:hypothetical protein [Pseudomonadota bacterium]